ncbi:RhoGAP domain protein, partial [Trichuris suis]
SIILSFLSETFCFATLFEVPKQQNQKKRSAKSQFGKYHFNFCWASVICSEAYDFFTLCRNEDQALKLLEKFLTCRTAPNLKTVENVNVLTSCVKMFLEQLAEPLIPRTSTREFLKYHNAKTVTCKAEGLREAFEELPLPNRDTLAFLLIHLRKIVQMSSSYGKTKAILARTFGPIVFRSSLTRKNECDIELLEQRVKMKLKFFHEKKC